MMELVQQLLGSLDVNEEQAKGGAGLLFKLVQEKLSPGDFDQVSQAVPEVGDLIDAAPESGGGLMGALGGLASAFGGKAEGLGNMASLAGGFSKLGLDTSMIGKFIPVILSFVQERGGDTIKNILEQVLKPNLIEPQDLQ